MTLLVVYLSCFVNRGKVTKQRIAKRKSPALCKRTKQSKAKAGKRAKVNNILAGTGGWRGVVLYWRRSCQLTCSVLLKREISSIQWTALHRTCLPNIKLTTNVLELLFAPIFFGGGLRGGV